MLELWWNAIKAVASPPSELASRVSPGSDDLALGREKGTETDALVVVMVLVVVIVVWLFFCPPQQQ